MSKKLTLKEELEILRGEPIQVFTGNPMDIPCIETSDSEHLCKHPVVSVNMVTYNHEPYIRQAIEGVMMQKTDFEFELVIGEDCSTDKTREICFEYQKRYPDKIRVLWSDHNLYRNPHPAGGNWQRNLTHCRGEFIAICEGDDYWIDPLKLHKQVDILKKNPNVGLCFCGAKMLWIGDEAFTSWNEDRRVFKGGLVNSDVFTIVHLFGKTALSGHELASSMLMTASVLFRNSVYNTAVRKYSELFSYKLKLADSTIWIGIASISDVYYIEDEVSVYRQIPSGICNREGWRVPLDGVIVRSYYGRMLYNISLADVGSAYLDMVITLLCKSVCSNPLFKRVARFTLLFKHFSRVLISPRYLSAMLLAMLAGNSSFTENNVRRMIHYIPMHRKCIKFHDLYASMECKVMLKRN